MKVCYCCGTPLSTNNFSIEHIIPNSIGGKLKSSSLLCKSCNKLLGSEIDFELGKQLNFFMNFFMVHRERGTYQPISGKTKKGEEYILNGTEIKSKPKITFDENNVSFSGNDEEDLKVYFKGLLKKYPILDIEEIIAKANKQRFYLNEPITLNLNVGGDKVLRAISKVAVNFYIYKGGDRSNISNILNYIKGESEAKKIWYHFKLADQHLQVTDQNLYHFIKIVGDSSERIVYCYIELFGTLKFIVYLDDNFIGESFDYQYFYNLFSKEIIEQPINIYYKKSEIVEILNNDDNQYFISSIHQNLQRTLNVAHKMHSDIVVSNIINESIEKVFGKRIGQTFTEEMLEEFVNDISYLMAVYLSRKEAGDKSYF